MVEVYATEKLKALYPVMQRFIEDEIYPLEPEMHRLSPTELEKLVRSKRERAQELGVWNLYQSEAHGGPGLTLMEVAQVSELMGRSPLGHLACNAQAPDAGNIELLHQYGSPEIRDRYLEPLLQGEIRSCFSMTEPEYAGSNPVSMGTMAVKDGDHYILNGRKWFTSSADGSAFAIVMCITQPEAPSPYQRASMIIVPTDSAGFELVRNVPVMGHAGGAYFSHAEIQYTDVRVPASNLLGPDGAGFLLAQQRLGPGRIHHCMRWIGICERSFELMCQRAATRKIGDEMMLGEKQLVQAWIAESRAEIDAARLMVLNAAYKMEREGDRAAAMEVSTIKFFVANVMQRVVDRAIQVHGALGITDDTILAFWYREERGARIYDGPDEAHKTSIARKILKKYGLKVRNR